MCMYALTCVCEHTSGVFLLSMVMLDNCAVLEVVHNCYFPLCVDFLSRQLAVHLNDFVVDGNIYLRIDIRL